MSELTELVHKRATEIYQEHYDRGREDAIKEVLNVVHEIYTQDLYCTGDLCERKAKGYACEDCLYTSIMRGIERLKEQSNGKQTK